MEKVSYPRNDTYILIPAYKPDHLMIELLIKLKKEDFDIVVVNDGSGEKYDEVFKKAEEYATILHQNPNKGKGAALRLGFSYVNLHPDNHNYVITCDADGQHAVEDIIRINDKLHETDCVVLGSRKFDKSVPKRSRNGNFMSRLCRTYLTKEYIQDDQCGLRGFPIKDVFNITTLAGDHYEYEMNVICNLQIKRLKFEEVQIETIYLDNNKSSHFKPSLDTFRIQRTIWSYAITPLTCALLSIGMLTVLTLIWPNVGLYTYMFLGLAYLFYYQVFIGVTAFMWPTKKMGRRTLIEGCYFTIKTLLIFVISTLLYELLKDSIPIAMPIAYTIALLMSFLINFPLAYLVWKVKNRYVVKHNKE